MDEKRYNNAIECVKVVHRTLLVILTLQASLLAFADNKKTTVTIPYLNFQTNTNLAVFFTGLLLFASGFAACTALYRLSQTHHLLTSDYVELFELYPSFLNTRRWMRLIAGLAFGLSAMLSAVIVLGNASVTNPVSSMIFLALVCQPFLGITIMIPFWEKV
ncbi:MAG TPA: hypothetical protein VGC89_20580 [Pyrinomonadaceae bacterium]|jgi:hypothetical protein